MTPDIGDIAPDFTAETSTGRANLHDWIGSDWEFFFGQPSDFTPVCTTEVGRTAELAGAFARRHAQPLGLFTDGVADDVQWIAPLTREDESLSCLGQEPQEGESGLVPDQPDQPSALSAVVLPP